MATFTATYSPDDNKLRLYASERLDAELYAKVKALGFRWAPKQDLFVAPMWTPQREDFLISLCGSIGDEDTTLSERAEQRAERFEDYSDKRAKDAEQSATHADNIGGRFAGGQPILVGHHSEKKARKDKDKMENAMRHSIKMWETSEYWSYRAAGAIADAKYKEKPQVRARRIKRIETDKRRDQKTIDSSTTILAKWNNLNIDEPGKWQKKDGSKATIKERALYITNYLCDLSVSLTLDKYPAPEGVHAYEGPQSLWSALDSGRISPEQAQDIAVKHYPDVITWKERWINHYNNRLTYEKAMLDDQGGSDLLKPKARPKQLPICNYKAEQFQRENSYHKGEFITYAQVEMTKAEYSAICSGYRGTITIDNSHRVRIAMINGYKGHNAVFLTDSKVHPKPEPISIEPHYQMLPIEAQPEKLAFPSEPDKAQEMRDKLESVPEIKVTHADQFYPTPAWLAEKMVDIADLDDSLTVLEPSAGGGAILDAIKIPLYAVAVELDNALFDDLSVNGNAMDFVNQDFLTCNGGLGKFDRVIMNPPFKNADDIKHIKHALTFLNPGGVLVAICAAGPRQKEQLEPLADYWEPLPEGTFKDAGTNVNTILLTIKAEV